MYFHPSLSYEMHKVQQQEWEAEVKMHQMYQLTRGKSNVHRLVAAVGDNFARVRTGVAQALQGEPRRHMHFRSRA